jgi:putative ABC transport system permease protein
LFTIFFVSLIPALKNISLTQFLNTNYDLKPVRFSYSNIKYMLVAQYAVVMIVVILAFGITKQMNMAASVQVGGNEQNILVMSEQSDPVKEKFSVLKSELLKHKDIEAVTACFQLPGDAIRDGSNVKKEGEVDWQGVRLMVVGEDFLPFFHIPLIAGTEFSSLKHDYQSESAIALDFWFYGKTTDFVDEYILNRKALPIFGFDTPDEAIGQVLEIQQGGIGYFNKGVIVGVTNDFNYTGLYAETEPLLIFQRNLFLHCIMVRLNSNNLLQARNIFENVWNEVNPDYPADYKFMNDVFKKMYRNEMNAKLLVLVFSILCFAVADLGLIVFMAYIIRRRTKEIGLRKVHGATIGEILKMLNIGFIQYITLAFLIAIPVAWYVMHRWLEQFAYRTSLSWWIFTLAGLSVLLVSVLSVTIQSWRAAAANPVEAIKRE